MDKDTLLNETISLDIGYLDMMLQLAIAEDVAENSTPSE